MQGIASLGWVLTEFNDTIPIARSGQDVIGQARLVRERPLHSAFQFSAMSANWNLQGLVLAPTRELAQQVAEEMNQLQGDAGLSIMTVLVEPTLRNKQRGSMTVLTSSLEHLVV